ncbi:MAG TPA: MFS transporter [Myxococcota bacterium]|nr:MFS transporter [Myxococcota bacterium]
MQRPLLLAALTAFVLMLGLGVLFPVLPFLTRDLGIPDASVGWLLAALPAASFVASPFWGRFSSQRGRRPAIVVGLLGYALGFGLFGLGHSFAQLLAARLLGGLISAAALPAIFAYVADVSSGERRSAAMGALGAGIALGVTFGPLLGVLTYQAFGLRAPYFVSAAIGLANALAVALALPESTTRESRAAPEQRSFSELVRPLLPFLACGFLTQTARIAVDSTVGFFAQDALGATPSGVGMLLFAMGIAGALVQGGLVRRLSGRVSDALLFAAGCAVMATGLACFGFARSWGGFTGAGLGVAAGFALLSPTLNALLSRAAESVQGEAQGLNGSATALSRVVAPLLFTTGLWPRTGAPGTYGVAAVLCVLALGVAVVRFRSPAAA